MKTKLCSCEEVLAARVCFYRTFCMPFLNNPFKVKTMTNLLLRSLLWVCILAVIVILFGKHFIAFINRDVVPY